ncbi:hypothetical protein DRQ36_00995 [bacterium]|nr:MAG: hypothetical protein DRQ36_00995 [bacterium]
MRKISLVGILVVLCAVITPAELNLALESGVDLDIVEGGSAFSVGGGALLDVTDDIRLRARVFTLTFSPDAGVYFGTGQSLNIVYRFPMETFDPYAVGGLQLSSIKDYTNLGMTLGGGIEFKMGDKPFRPFGELLVILSSSDLTGERESTTTISLRGGIRYILSKKR